LSLALVTFSGFRSIGMLDFGGVYHRRDFQPQNALVDFVGGRCDVLALPNPLRCDDARSVGHAGVGKL
jgi:hypothetical protein